MATKKNTAVEVNKEEKVMEVKFPASKSMDLKDCKIKNVSSPSTIANIAESKGINPLEVFVRVTFEYNEKEFKVSQQLRFINESDYNKLLEASKNEGTVDLTVTNSGFFYVTKKISVSDLFKDKDTLKSKDLRHSVEELFA